MPETVTFVAGGAVQAGNGVYLERAADRELLHHCLNGDFAYILTSRQLGKSSLMYRAAERLRVARARPVIIDLTELGAQTTADQWYKGFLLLVQEHLDLPTGAAAWWDAHAEHAYSHRLIRYLREVALVERSERIVLFVDEIDTTLRLDFTDDFFAAIRFLYQNRATDPELQRISFVLIGVATPNDLIKDASRTPFNIGRRIELTDFTRTEASAGAGHLAAAAPELIDWILRWTGGHPYLTMRVLRSLAESAPPAWTADAVDGRIRELFMGTAGESDTNLQFVRDMLTRKPFNREAVLATYQSIRSGARVPDKEQDQIASWLKLSGIVRRQDGLLRVRNAIYEQVFDQAWARKHLRLHINWRKRLTQAAAALLILTVVVTIPLAIYAFRQKSAAEEASRVAETARFQADARRAQAEEQLLTTQRNLETAQEAVAALKEFDPKAAAQLSTELTTARAAADQEVAALRAEREKFRKERDDAVATAQKLTQENTALRQAQQKGTPAAQGGNVSVPNVVGRTLADAEGVLEQLGLQTRTTIVDADVPRGTVVGQTPPSGGVTARGSRITLTVAAGPGASAETTAPVPSGRAATDDVLQVLRVLQRYKAGYEGLDAKAVVAVYPSANVARLQAAFSDFRSMSYALWLSPDSIVLAADGQSATVTASEITRPVGKVGNIPQTTNTVTFTLRKGGGAWTIQSIK